VADSEAVPAGLEGYGDAGDLVPCLPRVCSPALEFLYRFAAPQGRSKAGASDRFGWSF